MGDIMKILLLKTWLTNIGNGFIDEGAKTCIKKAFSNAEVIDVSGYSNYVADILENWSLYNILKHKLSANYTFFRETPYREKLNFINVGELIDIDVAILPGCILYEHALRKFAKILEMLKEKKIPIILLGAGGGNYSSETRKYVVTFIRKIKPVALITRDKIAYKYYADEFKFAHDGIDCGFFISDWYTPPPANTSFIVFTFDKVREPHLDTNKKIVRLTHTPFDPPFAKPLAYRIFLLKRRLNEKTNHPMPNLFLSDNIRDYLFFYKNAEEVHSDRVHACVAALAYGRKCKLYYKTERAKLLEKIVEGNVYTGFLSVREEKLNEEKERQIAALREALELI